MLTTDPTIQIAEAQRLLNEGKILAARQIYVRLGQVDGLSRATRSMWPKGSTRRPHGASHRSLIRRRCRSAPVKSSTSSTRQ